MCSVDVSVLAATPGRLPSHGDAEVRVAVVGLVDEDGLVRLRRVCVALDALSTPVLVDVERARTDGELLTDLLAEFRDRRHASGRGCRIRGLHGDDAASSETMTPSTSVAAHAETLRESVERSLLPTGP